MSEILPLAGIAFDAETEILIIGAGACGLVAALAAKAHTNDILLLERDRTPSGSTALSSGFIPATPTRYQATKNIEDSAALLAQDMQRKAKGKAQASIADMMAQSSGATIEWLADNHGLEWIVLDDFLYPGHSRHRMHAVPEKTGAALMARLLGAVERADIDIATQAPVTALYADGDRINGVRITRPDGAVENIGCKALILACNGYGGNRQLVARHIPEMADALYFGHAGNQGDAVLWGEALGADLKHLSGYQGHGSVAHPHGVLISWALMMEGGIQINQTGLRFSNEHEGYSEQAVHVLAQPGGIAWNIYDARLHDFANGFEDYRNAHKAGACAEAEDIEALAKITKIDKDVLSRTLAECTAMTKGESVDPFGREFGSKPMLEAPYYTAKVTGALFHTQGGLLIDDKARVLKRNGQAFANLYAGGGAACGASGPHVWGYLSGNGLLSAITLGRIAGHNAGSRT